MDELKRGYYAVDFQCEQTGCDVTILDVKAYDGENAEQVARHMLHPQFTWRCVGTDRRCEVRE
jgi:hypothetical protein